jgi:broad specificity phosphatase PhoE
MRIYLVRHGQSTHNAGQDDPHEPDPPLTALGREQARITAAALRAERLGARALFASPQRRALETAHAVRQALELVPHVLPDLCEAGGLREHAGMGRQEIAGEWPGVTLDACVTDCGWWTGGTAEDDEAVYYERAIRVIAAIRAERAGADDVVVVVTHGRFGSALVSAALGLGPAGYSRYPFDNCGISRLDFDAYETVAYAPNSARPPDGEQAAVRLRFHNRIDHLPPSHRTG